MIEDKNQFISDLAHALAYLYAKDKIEQDLYRNHKYEPGGIVGEPYKQKSGEMVRPATEQELKIFEMIKKDERTKKAWAETTISMELYHKMQEQGCLLDFMGHIYTDLKKVMLQKIPETVTIPNGFEDQIKYTEKQCDNGDVIFRAELYF